MNNQQKTTISLSEMFKSYEQDYKIHMEQIMFNLLKMSQSTSNEYDNHFKSMQNQIQQTEQCFKQMELEAATLPQNYRSDVMSTLKKYKQDMNQVEKDFRKLQYDYQDRRNSENVFSDRQIDQALLKQEDRLIQQTLNLESAKRTAYLTEQQANQVSLNLSQQTQQLSNTIRKTGSIREELGQSNGLVNIMKNRIFQKRMIVYGVFGFMSLCFIIILLSWIF